jgi:outer membrane protein assembly factor BamB
MTIFGRALFAVVLGSCAFAWSANTCRADDANAAVRIVPPEGDGAKYWPRWRGPSGQGIVEPGGYPDQWSDTENVLWKVDLPGAGNSSPIIWADRIFLTAAQDKGKKRSILCLNRADGKLLWEVAAPDANPEQIQPKNGYASGTPSTDGEHVWAYFGNHGLICVDFTGKVVWQQGFGEMDAYHGTSCSPLLYKDRVIVFQDHRSKSGSFVAAFDKKTGKELWKTARKEKVGWGSPIAIRVGDRDEIIVSSEFRVYSYHPDTGKELWSCAGNLVEVTPTPAVGHGLLYCCSGRVGPTLAIKPGGSGDVTKTNIAWSVNTGSPFIPSPLVYGDYLYMVNDIVSVGRCYDAKTGKLLWNERMGQVSKHGFSSSPIGVDGKVFFTNDSGETYVLQAGPEYKLLHVNKLNALTLATPALLDGKWYFRTDKQLLCIGKK